VSGSRPPRLLAKTLAVTFTTVAALLVVVFVVVTFSVREEVRGSVTANLESGQRIFAALEGRRQHELRAQAATLAESPRLKAAADTYSAEARTIDPASRAQALETIQREFDKIAAGLEADAVVLADLRENTLASAGRLADSWPRGRQVAAPAGADRDTFDGIVRASGTVFHVVAVPFELDDVPIGRLYLATSLDQRYAEELGGLVHMRTAIVSDGLMTATTLSGAAAREFESAVSTTRPGGGTLPLDGESYAFRRLVQVGDTSFYALGSIDESARTATRTAMKSLALIALGATLLALAASFWLARMLSKPVGRLSASLERMAASHNVGERLPLTGSSRELDALTETFNAMMGSLATAEAQTQAAYTGAIRALATALDARDPYTAGHSERVSALSVAVARALQVPGDDVEVIRLGALLHDIGKIGVPDEVLLKPSALTDAEFDIIKQHPVLGARILRSVPFLTRHLVVVELHHERPDGRGYPHGLRGDDIPVAARIVHAADAYDAMTSARAYRRAMPPADALRELWRCAGTEFHADVVAALATVVPGITFDRSELHQGVHA
jgi:putative nucleotidyltransferase with HDIG domain